MQNFSSQEVPFNCIMFTCSPILFLSFVASLAAANPSPPEELRPRQTKMNSPESRTNVSPWFMLLQDSDTSLNIGIFPPATWNRFKIIFNITTWSSWSMRSIIRKGWRVLLNPANVWWLTDRGSENSLWMVFTPSNVN